MSNHIVQVVELSIYPLKGRQLVAFTAEMRRGCRFAHESSLYGCACRRKKRQGDFMRGNHCIRTAIGRRWIIAVSRLERALSIITSLPETLRHEDAPIKISIQIIGDRRVTGFNP